MWHSRCDYVVGVPGDVRTSLPWSARAGERTTERELLLLGPAPLVTLTDFDVRPGVERTRVTLTALEERGAAMREFSFPVDRRFTEMLKPGDRIHMSSGYDGGFGISVVRDGTLVGAAGSVSNVPLGDGITVRYPGNLVQKAQAVFRAIDAKYEMSDCPVEVTVGTETRYLHWGRPTIGDYEVFIVRPFRHHRECVALTRRKVCPDCAATLTACALNEPDAIAVRPFRSAREDRDRSVREKLDAAWRSFNLGDLATAETQALLALGHERDNVEAQALYSMIAARRE